MQKHLSPWREMRQLRTVATTYGFAARLIGQRRAAGGYLALVLFVWTIAQALLRRQFSINTVYSIVAIAVIMRASDELNFKWRLPSPR